MKRLLRKIPISTFFTSSILVMFFLAGANFFTSARIFFYLAGLLVFFRAFFLRRFRFSSTLLVVIFFGITYAFFYGLNYGFQLKNVLHFSFGPACGYLIGAYCFERKETANRDVYKLLLAFGLGLFSFFIPNYLISCLEYGVFQEQRLLIDGWEFIINNRVVFYPATNITITQSVLFCIMIASIPKKIKSPSFWLLLFMNLLFVVFSIISLQTRGIFVVLLFSILFLPLSLFLENKQKYQKVVDTFFFTIFQVVLIFFLAYISNLFGFKDFILGTSFGQRLFSGMFSTRLALVELFFREAYRFPFGGMNNFDFVTSLNEPFHYFHNVWLDIYNYTGVIPLLFFLYITVDCLIKYFSRLGKQHIFQSTCRIALSFLLSLLILFFIEPVQIANFYIFALFFVLYGIADTIFCKTYVPLKINRVLKEKKALFIFNGQKESFWSLVLAMEQEGYQCCVFDQASFRTHVRKEILSNVKKCQVVVYGYIPWFFRQQLLIKCRRAFRLEARYDLFNKGYFAMYSTANLLYLFRNFYFNLRQENRLFVLNEHQAYSFFEQDFFSERIFIVDGHSPEKPDFEEIASFQINNEKTEIIREMSNMRGFKKIPYYFALFAHQMLSSAQNETKAQSRLNKRKI